MVTSSSMGRLFDAVSSLVGVRHVSAYEAQAAIELEAVAATADGADPSAAGGYAFGLVDREGLLEMDPTPVLRAIAADVKAGVPVPVIASEFHEGVARGVRAVVQSTRVQSTSGSVRSAGASAPATTVVLSGGVFQNVRLLGRTVDLLTAGGFRVLTHRLVPPNDGGLSLGQAVCGARSAQAAPAQDAAGDG